ncbi:benzoate/H(+) symporter BenE family transporter [Pseudomonas chlororaphis]|uniref:benzoate/H(+) symporter BenE family transporter n=1 Tax=Pseudomonas chlororaphis TaxID=587753 RepID=UPI003B75D16A
MSALVAGFIATLISYAGPLVIIFQAALVGLALSAAMGAALSSALAVPRDREAALITFLVTASGMSLFGLSAAFWGLLFGLVARGVLTLRRPQGLPVVGEAQARN